MAKSRINWFALIVGGGALALAALLGLWAYVSATATPLHPIAADVPSVTRSVPASPWEGAVAEARGLVRASLSAQNLPGVSVAIGMDGAVVWAEGFGWANLDDHTPVTPESRFRIGSASPALTAAAVGLLIEQGTLDLDEEIQRHVPEFPTQPWPVTLRQVMAHTAGLVSDGGDEGPLLAERCERPAAALPHFADRALRFAPGTDYRYSNYGYILVSAAVEAAAGEPFMRVMRKRVFEPLGMDDTGADAVADQVTSYFPRFGGDPRYGPDPMRDIDYSCYAGASAFVSTPTDLVRFGLAMSHGTLLRPATVQVLQSAQILPSGKSTGYGLGWNLETVTLADRPATALGHDGALLGGQAVSLMTFPGRGLAVAVTANMSYADTSGLAARLARVFAAAAKPPARQ